MDRPTIGIDLGGTKIAAAVVDAEGRIAARTLLPTDANDQASISSALVKVSRELIATAPAAGAIGVGAAGLVDSRRGVILGAPNLSYRNFGVRDLLAGRTDLPVLVDNDANVAAFGEARHGAGRDVADQVMVTVGTGIGGGIVIGGELYRGTHGLGAEIGHMVLDPDGPVCGCGNRGCWETLASGNAIGRTARERAQEPAAAMVLKKAGGDPDAITGEMVGEAAKDGDAFAVEVVEAAGRMLGLGFASLVNIFDPGVIVVGGGAATGTGELLLGPARRAMEASVIGRDWRPPVPVVQAQLGYDAGVVGAAALARTLL